MTYTEKEIESARKNPDCYDAQGGYIGPGAENYGSTQSVDRDGESIAKPAIKAVDGLIQCADVERIEVVRERAEVAHV